MGKRGSRDVMEGHSGEGESREMGRREEDKQTKTVFKSVHNET